VQVLVVEDERKVAEAIRNELGRNGFAPVVTHFGEDAQAHLAAGHFDAVVLDLMLPGASGEDVLSRLRAQDNGTAVLILTAKDAVDDRVHGLELGADDYLVKPFAMAELVARLRALLRRGRATQTLNLELSGVHLDMLNRTAVRDDKPLELTSREFQLLEYLMRRPGSVVSREMLARDVWQISSRATPLDNVIDVHISRLRQKVDRGFETSLIHTVRGLGFVMEQREG